MILTKEEATFLSELAPFAGNTPRRGIRFVNVYRLVKTSLTPTLRANLTGPNGNSLAYRALITQLAIVTGAPQSAWTYFERLAATKARTLSGFITTLKRNLPNNTENAHLTGALTRLKDLNGEAGLEQGEAMLENLRQFARIAKRYSFTARPN